MLKPDAALRRHPLVAVSLFYVGLIVLWRVVLLSPLARLWPLQLSQALGSWFYVPLWLLLGWALLAQRRRIGHAALLLLLVPLCLFALDYGRQFLPNWQMAFAGTGADTHLRVMSWNSLYRNDNTAALQRAMLELRPDLVAIQEIGTGMAADLPDRLGAYFPYQEVYATGGPSGMAILSRYPFLDTEPPEFRRGVDTCNCQQVRVDFNGNSITVINMHPWPPRMGFRRRGGLPTMTFYTTANQDPIVDALLRRIEAAESPLLVLGDLNTSERQPNYWRLRAHLADAFTQAGWGLGYTFPNRDRWGRLTVFPFIRIDYVFHDNAWITLSAHTGAIPGSDHRYVLADLMLAP